jgi:hypothetical protein
MGSESRCGSIVEAARSGVAAPVFADFVGKPWEREFAGLLASYYAAVRVVGYGGLWRDGYRGGCDGFDARLLLGAGRGDKCVNVAALVDGIGTIGFGEGRRSEAVGPLRVDVVGTDGVDVGGRSTAGESFVVGSGVPVGTAETVVSGRSVGRVSNREKREKRKRRKLRKQAAAKVGVAPVVNAVGVRDVATKEQMVRLAKQRAELYELENERKILKAKREIEMEKITHEAGANVARVDNWVNDVKSGSGKSAGTGWVSGRVSGSGKSKWSGSWRSRETVSTGVTMVSEEVHNAVLKRVAELEAEVKKKDLEAKKKEKLFEEKRRDDDIKVRVETDARVLRYRSELGALRFEHQVLRESLADFGQ